MTVDWPTALFPVSAFGFGAVAHAQKASSHPIYWGAFLILRDANKSLISGQTQAQLLGSSVALGAR